MIFIIDLLHKAFLPQRAQRTTEKTSNGFTLWSSVLSVANAVDFEFFKGSHFIRVALQYYDADRYLSVTICFC